MTGTEYERTSVNPVVGSRTDRWDGIAAFATPAPVLGPTSRLYPSTHTGASPGGTHHRRTIVLGVTGLALIAAALGSVAYVRSQETAVTAPVVAATFVVPHAAQAALASELVAAPSTLPVPEAFVPHAAQAALETDLGVATASLARAETPVPHAAQAALQSGLSG
jgi:hypothetical protein